MIQGYKEFLEAKSQLAGGSGFAPAFFPKGLFDFQEFLAD